MDDGSSTRTLQGVSNELPHTTYRVPWRTPWRVQECSSIFETSVRILLTEWAGDAKWRGGQG